MSLFLSPLLLFIALFYGTSVVSHLVSQQEVPTKDSAVTSAAIALLWLVSLLSDASAFGGIF